VHSINRPRTPLPTTKEREEPIFISSENKAIFASREERALQTQIENVEWSRLDAADEVRMHAHDTRTHMHTQTRTHTHTLLLLTHTHASNSHAHNLYTGDCTTIFFTAFCSRASKGECFVCA
jgi:hypothetical protein